MKEKKRMIGDVSRELGVPKHTIRGWESEFKLNIGRDEKGYRCYGEHEMYILKKINEMKEQNLSVTEIRKELPQNIIPFPNGNQQPTTDHKMIQFQNIMVKMMGRALSEQKEIFSQEITRNVVNQMSKEMDYQFRIREEQNEKRFQKVDEMIRCQQKIREEIAAATEKKRWFHRKKSK